MDFLPIVRINNIITAVFPKVSDALCLIVKNDWDTRLPSLYSSEWIVALPTVESILQVRVPEAVVK